jgi:uncharacterized protein YcbK (DUF882 family)
MTRRKFIKALVIGAALLPFRISHAAAINDTKTLRMYNIHTGERLHVTFFESGNYRPDAMAQINYFLRCHYTNDVKEIDPGVIDLLHEVASRFDGEREIEIISGYRSPSYNSHLLNLGRKVSGNSLHLQGVAIDFNIPGFTNSKVANAARSFYAGGVGLYPDFVHIDTGRVRSW